MAGAAASASILFAGTAAMAGPIQVNWVSNPPTDVPFNGTHASDLRITTNYGVEIVCSTTTIKGEIGRGSPIIPTSQIGTVTSLVAPGIINCRATALNLAVSMQSNSSDWSIVSTVTPAAPATPVDVEVQGLSLYVKAANCELDITPGTGPEPEGVLTPGPIGGYDARLDFVPAVGVYPLTITAYNGLGLKIPAAAGTCGGQIFTGDAAQISASHDIDTVGPNQGPVSH